MLKANMSLAKWESNSKKVSDMIYKEFEVKHLESESVKVLGIKWLASINCFSFDGLEIPDGQKVTKRTILSFIARLFDPVRVLTKFIMMIKILFQEIWILGMKRYIVPEDVQTSFVCWVKDLSQVQCWHIPRCYSKVTWGETDQIELHAFGDASEKGYGACVYIRIIKKGTPTVSFVISKW